MSREKLDRATIAENLGGLAGWTANQDLTSISRRFRFKTFSQAFGFMTRAALYAEKRDHHPDWSNVYNTVDVTLTTHDAGGLTMLDFDLAAEMDAIAAQIH